MGSSETVLSHYHWIVDNRTGSQPNDAVTAFARCSVGSPRKGCSTVYKCFAILKKPVWAMSFFSFLCLCSLPFFPPLSHMRT